jgi:hypothetical protein
MPTCWQKSSLQLSVDLGHFYRAASSHELTAARLESRVTPPGVTGDSRVTPGGLRVDTGATSRRVTASHGNSERLPPCGP